MMADQSAQSTAWRNRIVRSGDAALSEITANPKNRRQHGRNWRTNWYNSRNANYEDLSSENVRAVREIASPAEQSDLRCLPATRQQAAMPRRGLRDADRPCGANLPPASAFRGDVVVQRVPRVWRAGARQHPGLSVLSSIHSRLVCLWVWPLSEEVRPVGAGLRVRVGAQRQLADRAASAGYVRGVRREVQGCQQSHAAVQHGLSYGVVDHESPQRAKAGACALRGLRHRGYPPSEQSGEGGRLGLREDLSVHPRRKQAARAPSNRHETACVSAGRRGLSAVRLRAVRARSPYLAQAQGRVGCAGESDHALPEPSRDDPCRPVVGGRVS